MRVISFLDTNGTKKWDHPIEMGLCFSHVAKIKFFSLIWHDSPKQYCKVRLYGIAFKHSSCVLLELPSLVKKNREIYIKCPAFLNFLEKLEIWLERLNTPMILLLYFMVKFKCSDPKYDGICTSLHSATIWFNLEPDH